MCLTNMEQENYVSSVIETSNKHVKNVIVLHISNQVPCI